MEEDLYIIFIGHRSKCPPINDYLIISSTVEYIYLSHISLMICWDYEVLVLWWKITYVLMVIFEKMWPIILFQSDYIKVVSWHLLWKWYSLELIWSNENEFNEAAFFRFFLRAFYAKTHSVVCARKNSKTLIVKQW